ncbi:PQQ-binding-like beta-propeller repeat protein [Amycolatopsis palatopharyngis]|uniref:Rv3212 family protein n=1 Tax=Amycolatopsis palatopharyngis TaxID=187982 RepID=UPI003CCC5B43
MSDSASENAGGRHRRPDSPEPSRGYPRDGLPDTGEVRAAALGTEDVLTDPAPDPDARAARPRAGRPARRSRWSTRRDRVAVALIVLGCVLAAGTIWAFSDQRATVQVTAEPPPPLPEAPASVPGMLTEMWRAPSPATPVPVADGATAVTGANGEVAGRNAMTGQVRWRYGRDLPLCTVAAASDRVLAVHRKTGVAGTTGCSEVTQLDPATGKRTAQRNGDAEAGTRLVVGDGHVTTTGTRLLNTWRDDLVKSGEYGRVPALVNPEKQPRTGCTFGTVAAASGKVGVIERCPEDPADRLTVFKAAPDKSDKPEPEFSTVLAGGSARLIALSEKSAAVALPEQNRLVIYGPEGRERSAYPLNLPAADLADEPAGGVVPTAQGDENVYWFTGSRTMALTKDDLTPQWTVNNTLGAGTLFAGQFVVPIEGGLAVMDEADGKTVRTIGVDRRGHSGPVALASTGPVLLEQRGGTVVALR